MKQPRDSGMRGFGHRPLHVEMKHRLRPGRSLFSYAAPARASLARCAVPSRAEAHEIDIGMIGIRRPMPLEIIQERWPVRQQPMDLKVAQGKREGVVDADDCRDVLGKSFDQPFRDPAPRPISLRRGRWGNLPGRLAPVGHVDPQPLQARVGRLGARLVDADRPGKGYSFAGHDAPKMRSIRGFTSIAAWKKGQAEFLQEAIVPRSCLPHLLLDFDQFPLGLC